MKPIPDFENDQTLTDRQKKRRREYYASREENIRKTAEWQKDNRERHRLWASEMRRKNREKLRIYGRERGKKVRESHEEEIRLYRKSEAFKQSMRKCCLKLKSDVMAAYGGHCVCCGEDRIEFLALDHIHNDGAHDRRSGGKAGNGLYRQLKNQGFPQGRFQVLCFNCNGAKGYYGRCPHEVEAKRLFGITVNLVPITRQKLVS